jgi:hypothetical protein
LANPRLLVPTSDYLGRYLRYRLLETSQVSRLRFPPLLSPNYQGLAEILSKTLVYNGLKITLCQPNVGEGQYPHLWANRNGSSKKSASTSPVTLAAQERAESSNLAASAATATRVSFIGRLSIACSVGFPYVCPALAIAASASSTTCD